MDRELYLVLPILSWRPLARISGNPYDRDQRPWPSATIHELLRPSSQELIQRSNQEDFLGIHLTSELLDRIRWAETTLKTPEGQQVRIDLDVTLDTATRYRESFITARMISDWIGIEYDVYDSNFVLREAAPSDFRKLWYPEPNHRIYLRLEKGLHHEVKFRLLVDQVSVIEESPEYSLDVLWQALGGMEPGWMALLQAAKLLIHRMDCISSIEEVYPYYITQEFAQDVIAPPLVRDNERVLEYFNDHEPQFDPNEVFILPMRTDCNLSQVSAIITSLWEYGFVPQLTDIPKIVELALRNKLVTREMVPSFPSYGMDLEDFIYVAGSGTLHLFDKGNLVVIRWTAPRQPEIDLEDRTDAAAIAERIVEYQGPWEIYLTVNNQERSRVYLSRYGNRNLYDPEDPLSLEFWSTVEDFVEDFVAEYGYEGRLDPSIVLNSNGTIIVTR